MAENKRSANYCGIPLPVPDDNEMVVGAVVLLKVMKVDGTVNYQEFRHESLHMVEALGMATTFVDTCRSGLMGQARPM